MTTGTTIGKQHHTHVIHHVSPILVHFLSLTTAYQEKLICVIRMFCYFESGKYVWQTCYLASRSLQHISTQNARDSDEV